MTHEKKALEPTASHITEVVDHKKSTKQRLDALDGQSTRLCVAVETFVKKVETVEVDIRELNIHLDESRMMCAAMTGAIALLFDLREKMEAMRLQLRILQRVVGNGQAPAQEYAPRLKIPEPRIYGGVRNAKEVENFLFDMEQYFLTANIEDGARRALQELKHTGSIRDYVKTFSGHMLDIRDMSEKDKLFTFMERLKPWPRIELQRQKVADVSTTMGVAEYLMDYQSEPIKERLQVNSQSRGR
ncbi:Retrotrans gag domain-containing protein [Abeliophyllum distichum]|uniref:Retrotrans gag domain-containing protein n=1 Tax=Abeliophyllum distichum TaxID=126358 RepID=A0ABD1RS06_9LAMI